MTRWIHMQAFGLRRAPASSCSAEILPAFLLLGQRRKPASPPGGPPIIAVRTDSGPVISGEATALQCARDLPILRQRASAE